MVEPDWNPASYARFAGLRLQPALDLLMRVPQLPQGDVVDLGCGAGAVGPLLWTRFRDRKVIGVDASPAMLEKAEATRAYDRVMLADAAAWQPEAAPALIFSNALLHWLPGHDRLMPHLASLVAPGGTLAVQMPRQWDRPSHALMREVAARLFPERFDWAEWTAPTHGPGVYWRMLSGLGALAVWETEYLQLLDPSDDAHPVRLFTQSTGLRPILAKLSEAELPAYLSAYDAALAQAYPAEPDGSVLFPFRRLFFTLALPV